MILLSSRIRDLNWQVFFFSSIMRRYGNKHGNSGVLAFEYGSDYIVVHFNHLYYLYSHKTPGKKQVAAMKKLAETGRGLSGYISQEVKDDFEMKFDTEAGFRTYLKNRKLN